MEGSHVVIRCTFEMPLRSAHLAAGELAEVRFEVLSYHCVDGHQAEHTSFPHAALRVVVALFNHTTQTRLLQSPSFGPRGHQECKFLTNKQKK